MFWFVAVNEFKQTPTNQSAQSVGNKVDCGKATNVSDQLQHLKASTRCKGNHKCPKQFVALEKERYVQSQWYVCNHVQDVLARIKKDVSPVVLFKQRNKAIVGKLPLLWPGHFAKEVVGVGYGNFHVAFESYQPHQQPNVNTKDGNGKLVQSFWVFEFYHTTFYPYYPSHLCARW